MESNINLELIEKVKSGKFAIEHTKKEKDLEKLTVVLNYLFPNDTAQILGMGKYYYTFNNSLSAWWQSQAIPDGMEAIPLSEFFTNELPKEDKQLIGKIDELLGQLKTISQSVFELMEHASLVLPDVAPIEQVEQVRYVRCVISVLVFTEGHIYKLSSVSANNIEPFVMYNGIQHCSYAQYRMFFFPATEAEYLSQQEQPNPNVVRFYDNYFKKQPKWKEGDWAWNCEIKQFLGTLTFKNQVELDNKNGDAREFLYIDLLVKPTPEEIEQHLTKIAKEKGFVFGAKYHWADNEVIKNEIRTVDGKLVYDQLNNVLSHNGCGIWNNGKWATIVKEEVKEKWQPSYGCKYWYIGINDGQFFIADFHWGNDDVDFVNHDTGNCFATKEEAQSAADKIKALLATI